MENRKSFFVLLRFFTNLDKGLATKLEEVGIKNIQRLAAKDDFVCFLCEFSGGARGVYASTLKAKLTGITEILVLSVGLGWCAMPDKAYNGWLVRHLGNSS